MTYNPELYFRYTISANIEEPDAGPLKLTRLPNTGAGTKVLVYFIANLLALLAGIVIYKKTKVYGFYG